MAQLDREYRALVLEYGPGGSLRSAEPDVAAVAAQIWSVMDESWNVLKNKTNRERYRQSLVEPTQVRHAADLLCDQGRTMELQRRWDDARERYEAALELAPSASVQKHLSNLDAHMYAWMKREQEKKEQA